MTLCERCGFTTDGPLHRDYCPGRPCRGERYADAVRATERGHGCYLGHGDCATTDGGRCMDEIMHQCAADGCADCAGEA